MAEWFIGTSGFDYPEWAGILYPPGLARKNFLAQYAQEFTTLELNYTYYRMPEQEQLSRLMERAGRALLYSVKAHETMTHTITPAWRSAVTAFRQGIAPLTESQALGAVLLQFPHSFHYNPENRRYLHELTGELSELPLVVEFREAAWCNRRVFDALRARSIAYCSTDMPQLKGLPPVVDVVTSPVAYIRFHGRNDRQWWGSGVSERFDYLYTEAELNGWKDRIKTMVEVSEKLFIYFNNHVRGQAVINARMLGAILKKER